ncbi:SurA N-terminal domain-containing protein [Candidatus Cardinium hertigii]|uniref:Peptidylprolyl isomerase n=1 Tax=Candidatus Cardinium hertigii TaxID=247481 RepID=A0A2Z3LDK1_9BACT|nr:SurA N-terminal domain-containing protein [Candidatus Cardinium hertigii]AWN81846.1 hypothetical protein DK880_00526 [Candidatus Cardinium hertigii]
MTLLENIRKKAGSACIVIVIGCCIPLLLQGISDMGQYFSFPCFHKDVEAVGYVEGIPISIKDYHNGIKNKLKAQHTKPTEKAQMDAKQSVWEELIRKELYEKELKRLNLSMGTDALSMDEWIDLIKEEIKESPFDQQQWLTWLNDIERSKDGEKILRQIGHGFSFKKAVNQLNKLMVQSNFTTSLEKTHKAKYREMLCDVTYLYIPFTSISDDLVTLTTESLQEYVLRHKAQYSKNSDSINIQYIAFPIQPDEKDNVHFQKALDRLTAQFSSASDPYYFAQKNTDGHPTHTRLECSRDALPEAFASIKHTLQRGMVVGPVVQEGFHRLYKVVAVTANQGGNATYQIAVIEKKQAISKRARAKQYKRVENFAAKVKSMNDFKAIAEQQGIAVQEATNLTPADSAIGPYGAAKAVIHWLYTESKTGAISPIFTLEDVYLLVIMTEKTKKGTLPSLDSDAMYYNVRTKVLNEAKATIIKTNLTQQLQQLCNQPQAAILPAIAAQYKEQPIELKSVKGVRFSKNEDRLLNKANVLIGSCFGLTAGTLSEPIVDAAAEGVFIVHVENKQPQTMASTEEGDELNKPTESFMQSYYVSIESYYVSESMKELAHIVDKRYNYNDATGARL